MNHINVTLLLEELMSKERVIVAMSGGVDSSVAALLLTQMGFDVIGITLRLWTINREDSSPLHQGCCSVEDTDDARRVCQQLGIPHYVINAENEFKKYVVDYFVEEYQRGRTPHPCIACNDRIKFDFLLNRALAMDADFIATGHYARTTTGDDGLTRLFRGLDEGKDQSYVLFGLKQFQLQRILLPVGAYSKSSIRAIATQYNLTVAGKPDSQDICFIPQGDYRSFLEARLKPTIGKIVDIEGQVLGEHPGIEFFTIGQRRKLGLTTGVPLFVIGLNPEDSTVIVGPEEQLYSRRFLIERINWVVQEPSGPVEVQVKIRYRASMVPAIVTPQGMNALVEFLEPQRAITPGQAAVVYSAGEVLGGGFINTINGNVIGIQQNLVNSSY
jgi:tRNA-specific 2-thiouridylase